jgi:hypothetical protein
MARNGAAGGQRVALEHLDDGGVVEADDRARLGEEALLARGEHVGGIVEQHLDRAHVAEVAVLGQEHLCHPALGRAS